MDSRNRRVLAVSVAVLLAFVLGGCDLLSSPAAATPSPIPTAVAALARPSTIPNSHPTTVARATTVVALPSTPSAQSHAPTATAGTQGWSTFAGRYFTMQVPPSWVNMADDSSGVSPYEVQVEGAEWRISDIDEVLVDVRARYEPYSQLLSSANYTPFQAGDLKGETRSWTYTDIGFTNIEIDLPGTPDNTGPICYMAWVEMPVSLPKAQQDLIVEQFKQVVSHLAPSHEALQSTPTAIPAPPGVQSCSAANLNATVDGQGCPGFFCGVVTLTNTSKTSCSVYGRPVMKYVSHDGKSLPVSQSSLPPISGNGNSVVVLKPGGSAQMFFQRSHGDCAAQEAVPVTASWVMEVPGIVGAVTLMSETTFPVCPDSLPSIAYMEVGTFEAGK